MTIKYSKSKITCLNSVIEYLETDVKSHKCNNNQLKYKIKSQNIKIKEFEDNLLNQSLSNSINYNLRDKNKKIDNSEKAARLLLSIEERKETF